MKAKQIKVHSVATLKQRLSTKLDGQKGSEKLSKAQGFTVS